MIKPRLEKKQIAFFLAIIFLILILNFYSSQARNFFYFLSQPFQKIFWQSGSKLSSFFDFILERRNLKRENEILKIQNQKLQVLAWKAKVLEEENQELKKALDLKLEKDFKLLLVKVIAKDPNQDEILIDRGKKDGIKPGQSLILAQKVLVGKIEKVYPNFSKASLISKRGLVFDAKTLNQEIKGVIKGQGNLSLIFDLIPRDKKIEKGEILFTIPLSKIFPEGLLIGEIKKVKKSDLEPFQQAEVLPYFDLDQIENLFIITDFYD